MTDESRLQEALDILDNGEHWGKGSLRDTDADGRTRYCALGAIEAAWGFNNHNHITGAQENGIHLDSGRLERAVRLHGDGNYSTIPGFNDFRKTTWEDVALMFKKAIAEDAS